MAKRKILIIDGHPDPDPARFVHALAQAYAHGAAAHQVQMLRIADLDFPVLRDPTQWLEQPAPPGIRTVQEQLLWADHLVVFYPLWLGDMPALLKAFLEQALRPGFAFRYGSKRVPDKLLTGRTARLVVTMGTPGWVYAWFYGAHSVKSCARNILNFVGISPVRRTIIGSVAAGDRHRRRWLDRVQALGAAAA